MLHEVLLKFDWQKPFYKVHMIAAREDIEIETLSYDFAIGTWSPPN